MRKILIKGKRARDTDWIGLRGFCFVLFVLLSGILLLIEITKKKSV